MLEEDYEVEKDFKDPEIIAKPFHVYYTVLVFLCYLLSFQVPKADMTFVSLKWLCYIVLVSFCYHSSRELSVLRRHEYQQLSF